MTLRSTQQGAAAGAASQAEAPVGLATIQEEQCFSSLLADVETQLGPQLDQLPQDNAAADHTLRAVVGDSLQSKVRATRGFNGSWTVVSQHRRR